MSGAVSYGALVRRGSTASWRESTCLWAGGKLLTVLRGGDTVPDAMDTEPLLLTPGPLTTSKRTKESMLRDWGSWDVDFNSITGRVPRDARVRSLAG
jgi:hypothetical protein